MTDISYHEKDISSLDWKEHIRLRPGMYIGKTGNGQEIDDGIYILFKEVIDNSIDEHNMGYGAKINIEASAECIKISDFGRGIPLGKLFDCVAKINTGAKYTNHSFQKSVGLNGVGIKAVNALSLSFEVSSYRNGKTRKLVFCRGVLQEDTESNTEKEISGTKIMFVPDDKIFENFQFQMSYLEEIIKNYCFLNPKLKIYLNTKLFHHKEGLKDFLREKVDAVSAVTPISYFMEEDLECAFCYVKQNRESFFSFANGQYTSMGGSHQNAMRDGFIQGVREYFKKDYDPFDIKNGLFIVISIRIENPIFESQTKTKLGSSYKNDKKETIRAWIIDFLKHKINELFHRDKDLTKSIQTKILASQKERREFFEIKKIAQEKNRKTNIYNKKLRDCKIHYNSKHKLRELSTLFITEGDSASGSITRSRDIKTQAVFSLRGKPLNCHSLSQRVIYENEEFNLLRHALNLSEDLKGLKFNRIVLATDADVDGMHIRLLVLTFFLRFYRKLIENQHIFILKTPLFRVRNAAQTKYCFDEEEKQHACSILKKYEVTRFKGLGEISPEEFKLFIGEDMRLEGVNFSEKENIETILEYYMGKNTRERQEFIISNLKR